MLEFSHPHFDSSTYDFLLLKSTFDKKNCKPFIHYFDRKIIESSFSSWQYEIISHLIGKTEASRHLNLEIVIRPKCERQSIVDIDISQMCQRVKNQFRTPFVSVFWEKANISSSICDLAEIAVSRFFSLFRKCTLVYFIGELSDRTYRLGSVTIKTKCLKLNCLI